MYEVVYEDGLFWIKNDDKILKELGGYIDPVTPEIIIKEINDEVSL